MSRPPLHPLGSSGVSPTSQVVGLGLPMKARGQDKIDSKGRKSSRAGIEDEKIDYNPLDKMNASFLPFDVDTSPSHCSIILGIRNTFREP